MRQLLAASHEGGDDYLTLPSDDLVRRTIGRGAHCAVRAGAGCGHTTAAQIGFDRFVSLELAQAALRVSAGLASLGELTALLDTTHPGPAAKKKTRTVLNRLWLR